MNVRAEVHVELAQKALAVEGNRIPGAPGLSSASFIDRLDTCAQLLHHAINTRREEELQAWLLVSMVYVKLQEIGEPVRVHQRGRLVDRDLLAWAKETLSEMLTGAMGLEFAEREAAWPMVVEACSLAWAECLRLKEIERG